jgi:hypothetical protein
MPPLTRWHLKSAFVAWRAMTLGVALAAPVIDLPSCDLSSPAFFT